MSHSIKMQIELSSEKEVESLIAMNNDLEEFVHKNHFVSATFKKEIDQIKEEIEKQIQYLSIPKIETISTTTENAMQEKEKAYFRHQKSVDGIIKRMENLKASLNYTEEFLKLINDDEHKIQNIVVSNGWMAFSAIDNLNSKNVRITPENLKEEIEIIRLDQTLDNLIANAKAKNYILVENAPLPIAFKKHLFAMNSSYTTLNELTDFVAYLGTLSKKYMERKTIIEATISKIQKMGFKAVNIEYDFYSKLGMIGFAAILHVKNEVNKTIDFIFDMDGSLEYKMGNYEKHFCEADSEKLMIFLRGMFNVKNEQITRNVSNAAPILKAAKIGVINE